MSTTKSLTLFIIISLGLPAYAGEVGSDGSAPSVCATLEKFDGDLEILDASRGNIISVKPQMEIPCGGWLSLREGWAVIHHKQSFEVKVGADTLLQIFDHSDSAQSGEDPFVLFKGKILVNSMQSKSPLSVASANGRVRVEKGIALYRFDPNRQLSQCISISGNVTFENRFMNERAIDLKSGESSTLSFEASRVVPSTPQGVKLASVKEDLKGFPVEATEMKWVVQAVSERADRKFASDMKSSSGRSLASVGSLSQRAKKLKRDYTYNRSEPAPDDRKAQAQWIKRLGGGSEEVQSFLFPSLSNKKLGKTQIQAVDAPGNVKKSKEEEAEKARLIEALSKIEID